MEVRCGHCNKLFRVADDKITGTGIRFKCSKCGESVTITSEDFQRYKLSQETVSVLDTFAPKPPKAPAAAPAEPKPVPAEPSPAEGFAGFDIVEDHETAAERELPKEEPVPFLAAPHEFGEEALAGAPPLATPEVKPPTKPVAAPPKLQPKPISQAKSAVRAEAVSAMPASIAPPAASTQTVKPIVEPQVPKPQVREPPKPVLNVAGSTAAKAAPSGAGMKYLVITVVILAIAAVAFGVVKFFPRLASRQEEAGKGIISPTGLQVTSSLASWDTSTGDLVLNVTIENTSDTEKTAWYVVADVFDASGNILTQVKMLNGKQIYTDRDYVIVGKRNMNVEEMKLKQREDKGMPILPHGVISVEMRVMEPPAGVASFVATFQPFDPTKAPQP